MKSYEQYSDPQDKHLDRVALQPVSIVLQHEPTGMLDAILCGHPVIRDLAPDWVWITWCDQIAVSAETAQQLSRSCDDSRADLILPTTDRPAPYVHFQRSPTGAIEGVLHSRDGDEMPSRGEQDTGVFALRAPCYLDDLPRFARNAQPSPVTGERNFLPFVPHMATAADVETFSVGAIESVGINDAQDLRCVEEHLREQR